MFRVSPPFVSIRDKLLNLGYEKELEFLDEMEEMNCAIIPWPQIVMFDDHRHVKQPKPLTSKGEHDSDFCSEVNNQYV